MDENQYYERRLELEKSSSSAVTGKPLPASMQIQSQGSYFGRKDESLAAALEKAKERVQEMVKKRTVDIDSEPLYPTFKKSRVVPKSSPGVLTEIGSSQQLEDDTAGTDVGSKKKPDLSDGTSLGDSSPGVGTNTEGVASVTESQKNDAEPPETNKPKKSLPFIGKLPFLKAARTAKQAANEQSAADDKSKIDIKLNVCQTVRTAVQSEPTSSSSDVVTTSTQEQAVPDWPVIMTSSYVETSGMDEQNSLDAFLTIGDPESGQSQAVPVLNVGPQTRSEFLLENPPGRKQTAGATETSLLSKGEDAELANGKTASLSVTDVMTVPSPSTDVKAGGTNKVVEDAQLSATTVTTKLPSVEQTVPASSGSPDVQSQTDFTLAYITSTANMQTMDTQTLRVSEPDSANAIGVADTIDTNCNTDPGRTDHEDTSAMSLDVDDNTEEYAPEDNTDSEQIAKVPRDEETAKLLPQISAMWMEPVASGYSALSSYVLCI